MATQSGTLKAGYQLYIDIANGDSSTVFDYTVTGASVRDNGKAWKSDRIIGPFQEDVSYTVTYTGSPSIYKVQPNGQREYTAATLPASLPAGTSVVVDGVPSFVNETGIITPVGNVVDLATKYGISGTSTEDQTDKLNAAIAAERALNGTAGGILLLPKGNIFVTSLTIPTAFVLKGQGKRSTNLRSFNKAATEAAGFFIKLGRDTDSFAFDCRVEDLGISPNFANVPALVSTKLQEGSGIVRVGFGQCITTNIQLNSGNNQNFSLDDFECWCSSDAPVGTKIVDLQDVWGHVRITKPTIVGGAIGDPALDGVGIYIKNNVAVSISGGHFERTKIGIHVEGGHVSAANIEGCTAYGAEILELIRLTGDPVSTISNISSAGVSAGFVTIKQIMRGIDTVGPVGMFLPTDVSNQRPVYLGGGQKVLSQPYAATNNNARFGSIMFCAAARTGQAAYIKDTNDTVGYGWTPIIPRHAFSATYTPGAIPAGGSVTTTISVLDAVVGEFVGVGFAGAQAGLNITGWVSAAGVVTVQLHNFTASPITPTPGKLTVRVFGNPLTA